MSEVVTSLPFITFTILCRFIRNEVIFVLVVYCKNWIEVLLVYVTSASRVGQTSISLRPLLKLIMISDVSWGLSLVINVCLLSSLRRDKDKLLCIWLCHFGHVIYIAVTTT